MEKSGTTVRRQNPTFAILGLSHIGGRCANDAEWSSSLSVSCFGGSGYSVHHDERSPATSPRPTRHMSEEAIVRKRSSAKANRWRFSTSVDRDQYKPTPPSATHSTSLQVPSASWERTNQRPSHGRQNRSLSLSSESLVIRPLRGSAGACSNSAVSPSTRQVTGSRSRTKTSVEQPSRRDVLVLPPTTVADDDKWRGTSTTAGRHLDVFLPSLVVRQTVEPDE